MPLGYLVGTLLFAWCTAMALVPFRRPRRLARLSWLSGMTFAELPLQALGLVLFSGGLTFAEGDMDSLGAWLTAVLAFAVMIGLIELLRRAFAARPVVEAALNHALPERDPGMRLEIKRPWLRTLFAPWLFRRGDVERICNIAYGAETWHRLDLYRHRSRPANSPVLLYFHGGGFTGGGKSREARPLLYRLASEGWLCVSANYKTAKRPADAFPDCLVDVKRVIDWVRSAGREFGADPERLILSGSSAGAHLSATAALTANDPQFQPGLERADTSVTAAICLYGYYGRLDDGGRKSEQPASSPFEYLHGAAPALLIAHGDNDTYTSPHRARRLADEWRLQSSSPVVHFELPGAQHSFDVFHSIRFDTVVEGILAFANSITERQPEEFPRLYS